MKLINLSSLLMNNEIFIYHLLMNNKKSNNIYINSFYLLNKFEESYFYDYASSSFIFEKTIWL
jgi:hypothetical protein